MSDKATIIIDIDMAHDVYRAQPGINASSIAHGRVSMLHMHHAMTRPSVSTPGMQFGTAAHCAILEGGAGLIESSARRGSSAYETALAMAGGNEELVVKPDAMDAIRAMQERVAANRDAVDIIGRTQHEVSLFWTDASYGAGKARLDMASIADPVIADYKTSATVDARGFMRTSFNLGYHIKMGWYADAYRRATGRDPVVYIIAQESKPPYDVVVYHMDRKIWDPGLAEANEIARRYHIATVTNTYGGIADGVVEYELPAYALEKNDERDMSDGEMEASEL